MFNREINIRPPAVSWLTETVRWTIVLFVPVALVLGAAQLFAARPVLGYGTIHSEDMTIVLATINKVAEAELPRASDPKKKDPGYRFRLDFDQFVRPGQMPMNVRRLEVPFSASGYATNWEFGAKPTNDMKVMAHLTRLKTGGWELHPYPGGIVVLKDFGQPVVERTRKVCRLWDIRNPARALEEVVAGCRGDDAWFQSYCVRSLGDLDGSGTGLKLSGVIDPQMAFSIIFQTYTSQDEVFPDTVAACEYVFWNKFRGAGWELYAPRYPFFGRAVDKIIADGRQIQHNVFDGMVMELCYYPEHAQENYGRLLKVIDGKVDIYKFGAAQRLSIIYRQHTTDPKLQRLNGEIFKKLVQLLTHENSSVADGAAIGIGNVATDYAAVGPLPEKFKKLLQGETDVEISDHVRGRMDYYWRKVQAAKPPKLDGDVAVLSFPWDNLIGKTVVVAARSCFRDGQHGASAEVRKRRLWMDDLAYWPDEVRGSSLILLTGRLTKVNDLSVFRFEPGKPFGDGLPVPKGYSMEKARERYVLVDPSWKVLPQ